jgi:hypothetical protein
MVWLVHHNGGKVWVDELGWPWPKHSCFDTDASRSPASSLPDLAAQPTEPYDRTARAFRRCEFCDASLRLIRYAHHLTTCKSAKRTIVADAHDPPKRPSRKCEFCNSMVRLDHYAAHVSKVHNIGNPVTTPEITSAPIGHGVTAQSQVASDNQNTGQRAASLSPAKVPTSGKPVPIRCEFCKAMVKSSRYASHLRKAHSKSSDTHARRLCGKCHSIVDANLYDEHLRVKHGTTPHPAPSSKTAVAPDRRTTVVSGSAISKAKVRFPARCPKCGASAKDLEKHLRNLHPKRKIKKKEKRARKAKPITPKWADEGNFKRGMIVQGGLANGN